MKAPAVVVIGHRGKSDAGVLSSAPVASPPLAVIASIGESHVPELGALPVVATSAREAARRTFLERSAVALGRSWAERWREDLHLEGRPAAGGWPGTLREARTRVERTILTEMLRRKMPAITGMEREAAARAAYASARDEWRRHLDPETP